MKSKYICALCKKGFTRKSTVKDPHFPSCVRKNGNPDNIAWDDHPSCYMRLADGSRGPSNTRPAGLLVDVKVHNPDIEILSSLAKFDVG